MRLAFGAKDAPDRELNGRNGYWLVACLGAINRHRPVLVAGVERQGAAGSVMEAESGIHASELLGHGGNHLPEDLVGRGRPGQPGCYLGQDSGLTARDTAGRSSGSLFSLDCMARDTPILA